MNTLLLGPIVSETSAQNRRTIAAGPAGNTLWQCHQHKRHVAAHPVNWLTHALVLAVIGAGALVLGSGERGTGPQLAAHRAANPIAWSALSVRAVDRR